jgi:hypothetical protein
MILQNHSPVTPTIFSRVGGFQLGPYVFVQIANFIVH